MFRLGEESFLGVDLNQKSDEAGDGRDGGFDVSEWQPIETAPKDGEPLDLWVKCTYDNEISGRYVDCYWGDFNWRWRDDKYDGHGGPIGVDNGETFIATHWMRVDPPAEEARS